MAKKMPFLAVAIFSMAMLTSNANAAVWLEIIKGIVGGVVKSVEISTSKLQEAKSSGQASQASTPGTPPTPSEIIAALDKLTTECSNISAKGLPCAIAEGRGTTRGNALKIANTKSIQEMAKSINSYVEGEAEDMLKQTQEDGVPIDENEFNETMKLVVKGEVSGSQIYFTYTYVEEMTDKNGKTKPVYVVTELRVLNPTLFEKALNDVFAGKPISQQILDETKKGILNKLKDTFKKKK